MNKYAKLVELITVFSNKSIDSYRLTKIAMDLGDFSDNSIIYDSHPTLNSLITKLSDAAANVEEITSGGGDPEDLIDYIEKFYYAYEAILDCKDLEQSYEDFMDGEDAESALAPQDLLDFIKNGQKSLNDAVKNFTDHDVQDLIQNKATEFEAEFDKRDGAGFGFHDPAASQQKAYENYKENLRILKKTDPNNPKWQMMKDRSKQSYEELKNDPVRWKFYTEKLSSYNKNRREEAKKRKAEIENRIINTTDKGRLRNLEEELLKVNKVLMLHGAEYAQKQVVDDEKRRESVKKVKEGVDSFHGYYTAMRVAKDNIRGGARYDIVKSLENTSGEITSRLLEAKKNKDEVGKAKAIKELTALAYNSPLFLQVSSEVDKIESAMKTVKPFGKAVNQIDSRTLDNKGFIVAGNGKEALINVASEFGGKYPNIVPPAKGMIRMLVSAIDDYITRAQNGEIS